MIIKHICSINLLTVNFYRLSHYKTLNIEPSATQQQIKNSFLSLAKKYHPDNFPSKQNHEEFIRIKQAYDVLKDANLRKYYDMENFPQKIDQQTQQFYFYRSEEFQGNHDRRKNMEKRIANKIIFYTAFIGFTIYAIKNDFYQKIMKSSTMHQIRRQNVILANQNIDDGPSVQQRRLKQYSQQIKDKKIYGNVIQLKVRGAGQQSTRAKQKRLKGIASIEGIQKQKIINLTDLQQNQQYM